MATGPGAPSAPVRAGLPGEGNPAFVGAEPHTALGPCRGPFQHLTPRAQQLPGLCLSWGRTELSQSTDATKAAESRRGEPSPHLVTIIKMPPPPSAVASPF